MVIFELTPEDRFVFRNFLTQIGITKAGKDWLRYYVFCKQARLPAIIFWCLQGFDINGAVLLGAI